MNPDDVRRALERHDAIEQLPLPGRTNHRRAGVLVPIVFGASPSVIVTLRSSTLRRHAGEVCFPGGRADPDDADLEVTARREAREELGLDRVGVLGRLSSVPVYTSEFRLVPYVAAVPDDVVITPAPDEVAEVLRLDLRDELAQPSIEGVPFEMDGRERLSPIFFPGPYVMYGATAHVFHELLIVVAPLLGRGSNPPPLRRGDRDWRAVLADRAAGSSAGNIRR